MARIRTIKPEFWTDEEMAELSEPACLMAIGLLNYADDEGYFNANPKLIKAAVFPLREPSVPITVLIRELSSCGYLTLFSTADGKSFGLITNFSKHQVINKPKASKIRELTLIPDESRTDTGLVPPGMDQGSGIREGNQTPYIAPEENFPESQASHPGEVTPTIVPTGKFPLVSGWLPSPDFFMRAATWGVILDPEEYRPEYLAAFIAYWQGEGKAFTQVQWEQKFARHLEHKKNEAAKRKDKQPLDFNNTDWIHAIRDGKTI